MKKLRVIELFAGVGGFRLGLEGYKGKSASSGYKQDLPSNFEIIQSNQYEPSSVRQHANEVYKKLFNCKKHIEANISLIKGEDLEPHDLMVGGFPCEDYSVANSLRSAKGILGKKGVLWWQIERLIRELGKNKPKYLVLENVDRLLKSPANQRGRDFAIMLASLNDHGYVAEWRVLNAADFGFPQKRRRVFILAYLGNEERNLFDYEFKADKITKQSSFEIKGSLTTLSKNFGKKEKVSKFLNAGISIGRKISTQTLRYKSPKKPILLKEILIKKTSDIDEEFWIDEKDLSKWRKAKKGRSIKRTSMRDGKPFNYNFSEGDMSFPDKLDTPARTIITSEGGKSAARSTHIIKQKRLYLPKWLEDFLLEKKLLSNHKIYRRLTAIELERLNMFPDNHTKENDISNSKRAFFMGNALVVGIVEKIGFCIVENEKKDF